MKCLIKINSSKDETTVNLETCDKPLQRIVR